MTSRQRRRLISLAFFAVVIGTVIVDVTGIAFFDFFHNQRGVAPNVIELHPVLSIDFE